MQNKNKLVQLAMLLVVFSSVAVAMNGCSKQQSRADYERADFDHQPQDRRIGFIESLGGVRTASRGTHLLRRADGGTILLRSLSINLDEEKYKNFKVEVRGVLNYTTEGTQIMDVDNIDILDQAPTQEIKVVSNKDYKNEIMGFSAKFRDDFEVKETNAKVVFSKAVKLDPLKTITQQSGNESIPIHSYSVSVTANPDEKPLFGLLKLENDQSNTLTAAGYTISKITQAGVTAYKKADNKSVSYYFVASGKFWVLNYIGGNDDQNTEDMNVFYNFVNSMQLSLKDDDTQEKK